MSEYDDTIQDEFTDKEYAHAYMDSYLNAEIATQIKVLREQRGLTQEDLASLADMKQERISVLENVDYEAWSIKTLKKLAYAFDLALKVSFEEFGKRIKDSEMYSRASLERSSREDDLRGSKSTSEKHVTYYANEAVIIQGTSRIAYSVSSANLNLPQGNAVPLKQRAAYSQRNYNG